MKRIRLETKQSLPLPRENMEAKKPRKVWNKMCPLTCTEVGAKNAVVIDGQRVERLGLKLYMQHISRRWSSTHVLSTAAWKLVEDEDTQSTCIPSDLLESTSPLVESVCDDVDPVQIAYLSFMDSLCVQDLVSLDTDNIPLHVYSCIVLASKYLSHHNLFTAADINQKNLATLTKCIHGENFWSYNPMKLLPLALWFHTIVKKQYEMIRDRNLDCFHIYIEPSTPLKIEENDVFDQNDAIALFKGFISPRHNLEYVIAISHLITWPGPLQEDY